MIAIVGRPNVGKSSLLNRLLGQRRAIVDRMPGVTRDRVVARMTWRGRPLVMVDTGGLAFDRGSSLAAAIQRQVTWAIEEADLLLFVCDAVNGLVPLDARVADVLRATGKPVVVVANKADTAQLAQRAAEFHAFGFGPPIAVSSSHGRGVGELLDTLLARCPPSAVPVSAIRPSMTLAVVGRPNVGKSMLVNQWVGEERVTVDAAPGTTRDAIDVLVARDRQETQVIDTAGVRARPKLKTLVDIVSVKQSRRAIEQADVCLMLLDVSVGWLADDLALLGTILKAGCPCVVALNKWDLLEAGDPDAAARAFRRRAPFAAFVPVIAISAKTGYYVEETWRLATLVAARGRRPLPPGVLAAVVAHLTQSPECPNRLRRVRVIRLQQVTQRPLTVALTIRGPVTLHRADVVFVERLIRARAALGGVPLSVVVRA